MDSSAGTFTHGRLNLFHQRWGSGPHVLVAFHGYGRTHADFREFSKPFQRDFTVYAFDLAYHGKSEVRVNRPDKSPLTPRELGEYFENFLLSVGRPRAWVMGYSIGGRVALKLAEVIPEKIGGLYLFAPDGLKPHFMYTFVSETSFGRWIFRMFIDRPGLFFGLLNLGKALKFIDKKTHHFLSSQVETEEQRVQVYNVWTFHRHIKPDTEEFARSVEKSGTTTDLFFGAYDRIIPLRNAGKLKKKLPAARIHTLETGHAMLTPVVARKVVEEGLVRLPSG